jgi:ASC-1-like (ASCH) protein
MATRTSSVEVAIRVRPLRMELNEVKSAWDINRSSLLEVNSENQTSFTFDRVYDTNSETEEIYEKSVRDPIVRNVVQGYNGTVFAYGQTGSGKSHTMLGDKAGQGISTMAVNDLFEGLKKERLNGKTVRVYLEMLEIYNEQLRDLMVKKDAPGATLSIRENEHGVYVHNAIRKEVTSAANCLECMAAEAANRVTASTKMNEQSSRSHCLIRIIVEKTETFEASSDDDDMESSPSSNGPKKFQKKVVSSMNLVDLAGSERVAKTGATGLRMVEGGHINKSLTCLTTVIHKLSEPQPKKGQANYIPFRDSKLTHLLKTALGGNSFTTVFCCITPAVQHADESRSTLFFAQRAKAIKNEITLNEVMDTKTRIRELEVQLKRYKRLLVASDIYLWAKELMLKKTKEDAAVGATAEAAAVANEHVNRLESLVQQLTQENETLKDEAQQAAQFLGVRPGMGGMGGGMGGGHADPTMGLFGFADSEEVARLKARIQELQRELAEADTDRGALTEAVADLEEICEGVTKEVEEKDATISELRARLRKSDGENQVLQSELALKAAQLEQAHEQKRQHDQAMLERARGDELLENLTRLQIEHQALELEHNTLIEMFSKAEIESAATNENTMEEKNELLRRLETQRQEALEHNAVLWRFVSLGHLAAQGVPLEDVKMSQPVKTAKAEQALKALEVFVVSRSSRPPAIGEGSSPQRSAGSNNNDAPVLSSSTTPTAAGTAATGGNNGKQSTGNEEALQAKIKELEAQMQLNESRRDIIIDTKLKRMQELVLRLHTTNTKLSEDVRKVCEENNTLHDIVRRESKTAKAAKKDGLEPVNEQLLRSRALFTAVPEPPWFHN